jgi:hypothetical protein
MNILLLVIPAKAGFSIAEWLVIQFLSLCATETKNKVAGFPPSPG